MSKEDKKKRAKKPITFQPLEFDEAVADLLKVKPEIKESISMIDRSAGKKRDNASERHWGIWYLSSDKPLSLNIYPYDNPYPYEIELSRLGSEKNVLSWLNHFLESKAWDLTHEDIRDFLKACKELQQEGKTSANKSDTHWGY